MESPNETSGLRRVGAVHLGPVGGDLARHAADLRADGAEALALEPHVVGHRREQRLDPLGPGVGGEVELDRDVVDQRVPDAPARRGSTRGRRRRARARDPLHRRVGREQGREARRDRHGGSL